MRIESFEDLLIWQKAIDLGVAIYKTFENSKDWGFIDQIQRAAVSVSNNIAEGYDRFGGKQFRAFLYIAKGSCSEVRSMLYLARKLNKISQEQSTNLINNTIELSKMIQSLITQINRRL